MTRPPFPEIVVLNVDAVQTFVAGANDVCISIGSPGSERPRLSENFREVLRVEFHDWPWSEPCEGGGQITDAIAGEILAFALRHRDATRLVVHCAAGVSRSTSTAQALSVHLNGRWWFPKFFTRDMRSNRDVVNPNVFNAIARAFQRARPGEYSLVVKARSLA